MFETVFTVWHYCDGVREGIANVAGQPHVFVSEWDDEYDDYGDAFLLKPITEQLFELAMADEAIRERWRADVDAGRTDYDRGPVSAADRARTDALKVLLADLVVDPVRSRQGYPFRRRPREWPELVDTSTVIRLAAEFVWGAEVIRWREQALPAVQVLWSPC